MNSHEEYIRKIISRAKRDGCHIVGIIADFPERSATIHDVPAIIRGGDKLAQELLKWVFLSVGPDLDRLMDLMGPALEDAIGEATETADTLREMTEERARVLAMSDYIRELTRRDANKPRQE